MLIIRARQFDALREAARDQFRTEAEAYLRRHAAGFTGDKTSDDIRRFLQRQEKRAMAWGVTTKRGLIKWFYLAAVVSDTFDAQPACRQFLQSAPFTMGQKLDGLLAALAHAARASERQDAGEGR